jgi:hypothetical protein
LFEILDFVSGGTLGKTGNEFTIEVLVEKFAKEDRFDLGEDCFKEFQGMGERFFLTEFKGEVFN